jgi:5,8-dihydroxy-2-naphthoate synthase
MLRMLGEKESNQVEIRLAHSPDSDDAFMFYALATNKLDTGPFRFVHTLEDIQTLNQKALNGVYDVTAISFHAYAYVADKYALLPHGASMGQRYGPIVVARERWNPLQLRGKKIAVPGTMTTAYLLLKLYDPDFEPTVIPFDQIMEAVQRGDVDGGLLIHEGQLTYAREGLHKIVDLGAWWDNKAGLPLPLGGNAIRRELRKDYISQISRLIRQGIEYALNHRQAALEYAMQYGRNLSPEQADRFVQMYVNERTLDYGADGRRAVELLLGQAYEKRIVPRPVQVEFVS